MRTKHTASFTDCKLCQDYIELGEQFGKAEEYKATTLRLHKQAIRRGERDSAMRDAGLVKVRGALGGIFWE